MDTPNPREKESAQPAEASKTRVVTEDGLWEDAKPMMVLPVDTREVPGPRGAVMEIIIFQVVDPTTKTAMTGVDYSGRPVPVYITSVPIMIRPPSPIVVSRGPAGRS